MTDKIETLNIYREIAFVIESDCCHLGESTLAMYSMFSIGEDDDFTIGPHIIKRMNMNEYGVSRVISDLISFLGYL